MRKALILLLTFAGMANAGVGTGKVVEIYAHEKGDGVGLIIFQTQENTDKAACSTAIEGKEWAFRADTDQGKAMYALLLSAASSGKEVIVVGKGDCNDWGDRERPKYIRVKY